MDKHTICDALAWMMVYASLEIEGLTGTVFGEKWENARRALGEAAQIIQTHEPVVRCKDCRFWQKPQVLLSDGTRRDYLPDEIDPLMGRPSVTADKGINVGSYCNGYWTTLYVAHGHHEWKNENDYCSRGERRDNDDHH